MERSIAIMTTLGEMGRLSWDLGAGRTPLAFPAASIFATWNASTDKSSFKEN